MLWLYLTLTDGRKARININSYAIYVRNLTGEKEDVECTTLENIFNDELVVVQETPEQIDAALIDESSPLRVIKKAADWK